MTGLTYDAGALLAAERDDQRMWAIHRRALERGVTPTLPAAVLAEYWRGRPRMAMLVAGTEVEALDEVRSKVAGLMLGRCSSAVRAVDASVVEAALRRGDTVVTSNRRDVELLAEGVGRRIAVIDV